LENLETTNSSQTYPMYVDPKENLGKGNRKKFHKVPWESSQGTPLVILMIGDGVDRPLKKRDSRLRRAQVLLGGLFHGENSRLVRGKRFCNQGYRQWDTGYKIFESDGMGKMRIPSHPTYM